MLKLNIKNISNINFEQITDKCCKVSYWENDKEDYFLLNKEIKNHLQTLENLKTGIITDDLLLVQGKKHKFFKELFIEKLCCDLSRQYYQQLHQGQGDNPNLIISAYKIHTQMLKTICQNCQENIKDLENVYILPYR